MNNRVSWLMVVFWTALTALGVLLAGGLHFPGSFGTRFWSQVVPEWGSGLLGFMFGAVSGLFVGGLPALLLPGLGVPARRWVSYNALAYGLIHAVADGLPYRPLVIWGGGPVLAACQYLAMRHRLTRPVWWLPMVTVAWWLGFGLTEGTTEYNLLVIGPLLGAVTGLQLRLLLIPAPTIPNRWWTSLKRPARIFVIAALVVIGSAFMVMLGGLPELTTWPQ